jgi:hypothetical protein
MTKFGSTAGAGSTSTNDVWQQIFSITGKGILKFLNMYASTSLSSGGYNIRLTIDGIIITTATNFNPGTTSNTNRFWLMQDLNWSTIGSMELVDIPFNKYLVIEVMSNYIGSTAATVYTTIQINSEFDE